MEGVNRVMKIKDLIFFIFGIFISILFICFTIPIIIILGSSYLFSHFLSNMKGNVYERNIEIK